MINKEVLQEALILLISGLGLTVAPSEFFGGFFLAMAFGVLVRMFSPEMSRRSIFATLFTSIMTGILFDFVISALGYAMPFQLSMMLGGITSAFTVPFLLKIQSSLYKRSDRIVASALDKALPTEDRK